VGSASGEPRQAQERLDQSRVEVGAGDGLELLAAEQEPAPVGIGGSVE